MSVIDASARFSHARYVLTHDDILTELVARLDAKEMKGKDVARHLNVAPARITEIRKGARRIQPDEMHKLAALLGLVGEVRADVAEVINIWDRIADDRRSQALTVLRTFIIDSGH